MLPDTYVGNAPSDILQRLAEMEIAVASLLCLYRFKGIADERILFYTEWTTFGR